MSSLVRRLQIRILKRQGYVRETWAIRDGQPVRLRKGEGRIASTAGVLTKFWPRP